jgi:hypothetical protein
MAKPYSVRALKGVPAGEQGIEFINNLSKALGYLVINWGLFEFSLTAVIATIYHEMGGKKIEPELPIKLSRNAKLIRKCAQKIPALAPYRDEIRWIAGEALRISPLRNDILHGYIASYEPEKRELLVFAKATPDQKTKTVHIGTLLRITAADLIGLGNDTLALSQKTADLGNRLMETVKLKD